VLQLFHYGPSSITGFISLKHHLSNIQTALHDEFMLTRVDLEDPRMTNSSQPFRTDALNPSSLPTASLGKLRPLSSRQNLDPTTTSSSTSSSSNFYETYNTRIDQTIKSSSDSLKSLISSADVCPLSPSLTLPFPNQHLLWFNRIDAVVRVDRKISLISWTYSPIP